MRATGKNMRPGLPGTQQSEFSPGGDLAGKDARDVLQRDPPDAMPIKLDERGVEDGLGGRIRHTGRNPPGRRARSGISSEPAPTAN